MRPPTAAGSPPTSGIAHEARDPPQAEKEDSSLSSSSSSSSSSTFRDPRPPNRRPSSLSVVCQDVKASSSSGQLGRMPKEIMAKIFAHLPVESLMRLKSLNKSWYFFMRCLVKDPEFVAKHLDLSPPSWLLMCYNDDKIFEYFFRSLVSSARVTRFIDDGDDETVRCIFEDIDLPSGLLRDQRLHVIPCYCNGVICFTRDRETLTLYNPVLCEYDTFKPATERYSGSKFIGIGFGCDSTSGTYKVVRLSNRHMADVFTLGAATAHSAWSWRRIDMDVDDDFEFVDSYVYLKGNCVWKVGGGYHVKTQLLCFDVSSETFWSVHMPCESSEGMIWSLCVFNDSVCMTSNLGNAMDIWVMDLDSKIDDGLWTKVLRIESSCLRGISRVMGFWSSNEILIDTGDFLRVQIASFNLHTQKLRRLSHTPDVILNASNYVASLVSVKKMINGV